MYVCMYVCIYIYIYTYIYVYVMILEELFRTAACASGSATRTSAPTHSWATLAA